MKYTRREFGKLALAGVPAAAILERSHVASLEYEVPQGSDAVKEVAKCLQYCKKALA